MSLFAGLTLILFVAGVAWAAVWFTSRRKREAGSGESDLLAYLLLAIAVGTTVFGLAQLGRAAFPGESILTSAGDRVPGALAALVVGGPFAFILWRRQADRRKTHPETPGWPLYLGLAEAVLTTTLVVVIVQLLDWLLGEGPTSSWTDVVILGGAVTFHEWAARRDPPGSDVAELPRVVGSAIGFFTTAIGLGGLLFALFDYVYGTIYAGAGGADWVNAAILLGVGGPLWWYRWLRPWDAEPGIPRKTWLVTASTVTALAAIGSLGVIVVTFITFWLGDVDSAARHFEVVPGALAVLIVAGFAWWHHRRRLNTMWAVVVGESAEDRVPARNNTLRSHQYLMAAAGLSVLIGSLTGLAAAAFGAQELAGDRPAALVSLTVVAIIAIGVWGRYWSQCQAADRPSEAMSRPRRIYLIGLAVIAGLIAAQALIATLVVLFQALFGQETNTTTLAVEGSLTVFATLATVHLLMVNRADRALQAKAGVIVPFRVTVICSHPGPLATTFPKEAKLQVIHRGDGVGIVDATMAEAIVEAVHNSNSIVWVGADGFEVAPSL